VSEANAERESAGEILSVAKEPSRIRKENAEFDAQKLVRRWY
jgi:hypothetical protein